MVMSKSATHFRVRDESVLAPHRWMDASLWPLSLHWKCIIVSEGTAVHFIGNVSLYGSKVKIEEWRRCTIVELSFYSWGVIYSICAHLSLVLATHGDLEWRPFGMWTNDLLVAGDRRPWPTTTTTTDGFLCYDISANVWVRSEKMDSRDENTASGNHILLRKEQFYSSLGSLCDFVDVREVA